MRARYADGRAAVMHDVECELGGQEITIRLQDATHAWRYDDLRRADDGNGRIVLKRKPDTGERLVFDVEATNALGAAAPTLFRAHAHGVEPPRLVIGLVAAAWSLAGVFLFGAPMAAAPIADNMPASYRAQIADISWSQVNAVTQFCDDSDEAERILNEMAHRVMAASDVPHRDQIWISIVDADFPNAFALPHDGGTPAIIVTDDLIQLAGHPDELTGVIAHEIAHIERNHVMKNIVRQVGAGIFFDVVFGGAGAGQAIAVASVNLAGLRYSRGDEEEADARGLDYLDAAGIDSAGLARLFDRIQQLEEDQGVSDIPTLLLTHPATPARAAAARARSRQGLPPSLSDRDWRIVRQACGGSPEPAEAGATGED